MKRIQIRALTLAILLTLTLCLLPAMAGAYHLKPEKLEFTVGEYDELSFWYEPGTGETNANGHKVSSDDDDFSKYGLNAEGRMDGGMHVLVYGTPTKAGDCSVSLILKINGTPVATLSIPIIIREKETPVPPTPTAPTVVDNVIYNAAPEHEQALIRGVREWCNVRAGAGTDSAVIGRANLGQQISLLRWNTDESWCFVEFNGLQGWIAKQFILPIK